MQVPHEPLAVIDASLALKALLPNPDLERCQAALARLQNIQLVAPALWVYEIASTLAKAVHFGQLSPEESKAVVRQALALDVQLIAPDETQSMLALDWTLRLNRASAYDSFYLAIAEALDAPFWTADRGLASAVQNQPPAWLHWVGESG